MKKKKETGRFKNRIKRNLILQKRKMGDSILPLTFISHLIIGFLGNSQVNIDTVLTHP